MIKKQISQYPQYVENRKLYSGKLRNSTIGANFTQFVELINSTYGVFLLFSAKVGSYTPVVVGIAFGISFLIQSFIRVNFAFLGKLRNDNKDDKEQRFEITSSFIQGIIACMVALALTGGTSYFLSKQYNSTERKDVVSIHTNYNEREGQILASAVEKTAFENKNNDAILFSISEKYDAKLKASKNENDKQYIADRKAKETKKQIDKHTAAVAAIEAQKNNDLNQLNENRNKEIADAKTINNTNETAETKANNYSYYIIFGFSVMLVVAGAFSIYNKGKYMELCGITEEVVNEERSSVDSVVIGQTLVRRVVINWIKRTALQLNNKLGTDLDDVVIDGTPKQPKTQHKKTVPSIVFNVPVEPKQEQETVETKEEQPQTNVVEFDLNKSVPIVEQQNTQNITDFELNCKRYLKGVSVNQRVEELMSEYAKGNALDLGARRSGIGTALKRFYEYSARLSDTTDAQQAKRLNRMIHQQAENILANGLYILQNGGAIESGVEDNGLFFVTVKLKRK